MALCNTLNRIARSYVDFDPTDPEHLEAFKMLVLGENGPASVIRQHPTLRFNVDHPYDNVRSMMMHKVAEEHIRNHTIQ